MNRLLLFVILCLGSVQLNGQSITAVLSSDSLHAGQAFEVRFTIDRGGVYETVIPPDSSRWGDFLEYRGMRMVPSASGRDSLIVSLQFFGTKDTLIAPVRFALVGADTLLLESMAIPVLFKSLVPGEQAELQPLKPIFEFAMNWWMWILIGAILIAAGIYIYRRWKKRPVPEIVTPVVVERAPFVSPLDVLRTQLEDLKRRDLIHQQDIKTYYSDLGDILRRYIEDAHGIPALESTTGELRTAFKNRGLHSELAQPCLAILEEADMVKFAKFTPTAAAADACHKQARVFAEAASRLDHFRIQLKRDDYERTNDPA
jgi:hypothetical protein